MLPNPAANPRAISKTSPLTCSSRNSYNITKSSPTQVFEAQPRSRTKDSVHSSSQAVASSLPGKSHQRLKVAKWVCNASPGGKSRVTAKPVSRRLQEKDDKSEASHRDMAKLSSKSAKLCSSPKMPSGKSFASQGAVKLSPAIATLKVSRMSWSIVAPVAMPIRHSRAPTTILCCVRDFANHPLNGRHTTNKASTQAKLNLLLRTTALRCNVFRQVCRNQDNSEFDSRTDLVASPDALPPEREDTAGRRARGVDEATPDVAVVAPLEEEAVAPEAADPRPLADDAAPVLAELGWAGEGGSVSGWALYMAATSSKLLRSAKRFSSQAL